LYLFVFRLSWRLCRTLFGNFAAQQFWLKNFLPVTVFLLGAGKMPETGPDLVTNSVIGQIRAGFAVNFCNNLK